MNQPIKWEYVSLKFDFNRMFSNNNFDSAEFDQYLNANGWEGWELVNVFDTNIQGGTKFVVAVMKRPITIQREKEIASSR